MFKATLCKGILLEVKWRKFNFNSRSILFVCPLEAQIILLRRMVSLHRENPRSMSQETWVLVLVLPEVADAVLNQVN